jgi:hypothetical protein
MNETPVFEDILAIVKDEQLAQAVYAYLQKSVEWNTTCVNCARMLGSWYESQEEADCLRDELETVRSLLTHME